MARFEAGSIQDMVSKFEPDVGFERSFISILALKVARGPTSPPDNQSRAELQLMRSFYRMDFEADMDEEILRWT